MTQNILNNFQAVLKIQKTKSNKQVFTERYDFLMLLKKMSPTYCKFLYNQNHIICTLKPEFSLQV